MDTRRGTPLNRPGERIGLNSSKTGNLTKTDNGVVDQAGPEVATIMNKQDSGVVDAKPAATKHNTRSRNGIDKSKISVSRGRRCLPVLGLSLCGWVMYQGGKRNECT